MDLIADALLLAGALTAAFYCWTLSKRIKRLSDLDGGLGSAIGSLSAQVSEMRTALKATQAVTGSSISEMEELVARADKAADNLRLMLATIQEERTESSKAKPKPRAKFRPFKDQIDAPDLEEIAPSPAIEVASADIGAQTEPDALPDPVVSLEPEASAEDLSSSEPVVSAVPSAPSAPKIPHRTTNLEDPLQTTNHEEPVLTTNHEEPETSVDSEEIVEENTQDVRRDENPPVILAHHKTPAAKLRSEVEERILGRQDDEQTRDDLVEALQKILAAGQ